MSDDLRNLLDREASRVSAKPDAMDGVMRRAERRHRGRQVMAGVTALALFAGVALGAVSILGNRSSEQTPGNPDGGAWAGIWPHRTQAEAEDIQRRLDAGNPELEWHANLEQVASNYFEEVHGWTEVFFDDSLDSSGQDALTIYAASCNVMGEGEPCEGVSVPVRGDEEAMLTLERLVKPGTGGIWSVTKVIGPSTAMVRSQFGYGRMILLQGTAQGDDVPCPDGDLVRPTADQTQAAIEGLLSAANSPNPDPEALWGFVEPSLRPFLGPEEIFAHHVRTLPVEPYGVWEVQAVDARDVQNAEELEERCPGSTQYLSEAYVLFPGDPLQAMPTQFQFIGRADGLKLWRVS